MIKYLSYEDIVMMNAYTIAVNSPKEQHGVKLPDLLHSAVHRPKTTLYGEEMYKDIHQKATVLFESLLKNHCFHNGNKRTAYMALQVFYRTNGYNLQMTTYQSIELVLNFTTGVYTKEQVYNILEKYTISLG